MKIVLGSDEKTELTDHIGRWLREKGHDVTEVGHLVDADAKWHWAEIGMSLGRSVADGSFETGIVCCWSGTGVSIAANRVKGARAALCWDAETARLARKWDDANILALSLRYTSVTVATEILEAWFATAFDEEDLRQARLVDR